MADADLTKQAAGNVAATRRAAKDAEFLNKEFEIAPEQASAMVAKPAAPASAVRDQLVDGNGDPRHQDALADAPTPEQPQDDIEQDNDETRLKPVLSKPNLRQGP